jgi:putative membrane protein
MKRTLALTAAALAALSLAACNQNQGEDDVAEASAESGVGSNAASNTVQDATGAAVGAVSAATAGRTTQGYVSNAAEGDMYEIQAAEIAMSRSKNAAIKELAGMIKKDHSKAAQEMTAAVKSAKDATIPSKLDERRQGFLDNLKQAPADQFDKVWLTQQEAAHEESLTLHRTYADAGDVAPLKAHAAKSAPIVEKHLEHVRKLDEANASGKPAAAGH